MVVEALPPIRALRREVLPRLTVVEALTPMRALPREVPPRLWSEACRTPGKTGCRQGSERHTWRT